MEPLPYDILEAMIQCFGRAFHFKDAMAAFLASAGVEQALIDEYRQEKKFPWARHVLTALAQTENGRVTQRRILAALCNLRNVPDSGVENRDAGLDALRVLKRLALERDFIARRQREKGEVRSRTAEERARLLAERAAKLAKLRDCFSAALTNDSRQEAGYDLEDLLCELFALFEMEYKKSYRTPTQQIDGHFNFHGFDYLVEAKWRRDQPPESEIGSFKTKVDTQLESTRGLFLSIAGFRPEVVEQFNGRGANIILMDGGHLIHILEGRVDLRDALQAMIEGAAQRGVVFTPIC